LILKEFAVDAEAAIVVEVKRVGVPVWGRLGRSGREGASVGRRRWVL